MSFEATITARLRALCGGRAWPDLRLPTVDQALPFVTWQQVGGDALWFLEGGHPGARVPRIMVHVWGSSRLTVNELMRAIEVDLLGPPLRANAIGALTALYEPVQKLFGARQDFSVFYRDD